METLLRLSAQKALPAFILLALLITAPYMATAQLAAAFNDAVTVVAKKGDDVATGTSKSTVRASNVPYVAPQRVNLSFTTPSPKVTRRPSSTSRIIDNSSNASFDRAMPDPQATRRAVHLNTNVRSNTSNVAGSFERKKVIDEVPETQLERGKAAKGGKELFNFSSKAATHFANPARKVPLQIMDDVIKNTKGLADPRGSRALMHYSTMTKNGKLYNLEILYDKTTNSIWHFQYGRGAMGPLTAIPK